MRKALLFFFSHRTLADLRWDLHFSLLRLANALTLQNFRLGRRLNNENRRYLNLGSGPRGLADEVWVNVDGYRDRNVEACLDFTRPLPFPENRFDGVFCEHVIEHFDQKQGRELLSECQRILKPGGCLRAIVPDGEKIMKAYFDAPTSLIERRGNGVPFAIDAVNSYFRQRYEHQFIYDWPMLEYQLLNAGFTEVRRVAYKTGVASVEVMLDDEKYEWESLYVEAVKPA